MHRVLRARWLLPIDRPPISGGWIECGGGRIVRVGVDAPPTGARDLGNVAVLPGLVNAHTHLELSWMAGRVPPAESFGPWLRQIIRERAAGPPADDGAAIAAAEHAIVTARESGTVLVGDVCNTLVSAPLVKANGLGGVVFHELLGFNAADPEGVVRDAWARVESIERSLAAYGSHAGADVRAGVVAHALYSASPALVTAVARRRRTAPLSIHLAESIDEVEFLRTGRGMFRSLLRDLNAWNPKWQAPEVDPAEYLDQLKYLVPGCLVVHGVHLTPAALERLRERGAFIVTCPRSNQWVGAGTPPIAHFYASGVPVAIGTDSLASVATLNMFDEIAAVRRIAPEVSAPSILESATRVGADALGFSDDYGTLTPGKRAALIAVRVPPDVQDVEEYLVGGIAREDIDVL
jgi:cytosine/adenosine deaminase-related metal-dependent hydrolase